MTLYKWTGPNRTAHDGFVWPAVGEWTPRKAGPLKLNTSSVYHLCLEGQLVYWINAELYEAEYDGDVVEDTEKIGAQCARLLRRVETWNARTARLFARDCAEWAPTLGGNPDPRILAAVEFARRFASSAAFDNESDAAWSAAEAAAWSAEAAARSAEAVARSAAWSAARARQNARLLEYIRGEVAETV